MTGPPPYLKVSRSGTSTEINILSINIQPELDMTLRENHTFIERVAYGMEIFRRKKTQILCMQIKNVDLETIPLCILDYVGFMTFNCFACLLTSSRYKWSMQMLRHRILIIPGNPQKTDFILCFIPKLALLEPFNVKSLT